jgi:poly-gamma-glutamate synthesis protein (capsule biosynthesis protein)
MEKKKQSLKAVFAGDLCMREISGRVSAKESKQILAGIQPLLDAADLRLINLENPLFAAGEAKPIAKTGPNLEGRPEDVAFLKAGGFDCAVLANNHLGDFDQTGVLRTLEILDENGIGRTGGGRDIVEAYRPWLVEKNGIRLAVLAVAENEFGGADYDKAGSAGFSLGRLARAVADAASKADHVVVVFHGGNEYNPLPSPRVVERYRLIIEWGASAVIGMHPHCPQGWEIHQGCPIVYSTGNFLFHSSNQEAGSSWYYGYLAQLEFAKTGPARLELAPYRFDPACTAITPYTGKDKEKMLAYLAEISQPIKDEKLLADYFKGWCSITGPSHVKLMQFQDEFLTDPALASDRRLLAMRNLYTCEAHNELLTATLRLIEEQELDFARQMAEKIRAWQKMPV